MVDPVLVVMAGRPGTGKTTLSRSLAPLLGAAILRTDVIATVLMTSGLTDQPERAGDVTHDVTLRLAAEMLGAGTSVIIDGVNATHERRKAWVGLADETSVPLCFIETHLPDVNEHRRRVDERTADVPGMIVPSWDYIGRQPYAQWDEAQEGPRLRIDMSDLDTALVQAQEHITARSISRG
jgi:predicted kinase